MIILLFLLGRITACRFQEIKSECRIQDKKHRLLLNGLIRLSGYARIKT